jgi:hypothetical protein
LKAAGDIYRRIVDDASASRSLVAQAQLRWGLCELKLGNKPQAISALERLTQDFPDKDKLLALVEQHMPQLLDEMLQRIEHNYIEEVDRVNSWKLPCAPSWANSMGARHSCERMTWSSLAPVKSLR